MNDLFKMTSHFLQVIPESGRNLQEMNVIFLVLYAPNLHGIDMIFQCYMYQSPWDGPSLPMIYTPLSKG
jgi:hypothetical protein